MGVVPWRDKTPCLMGVVNVTPDSFSDGGAFYNPEKAIEHGLRLVEDGADILDIGGESTRPHADPVSPQQEMDRVLPMIDGLRDCGCLISIDTRHAGTMQAALRAGAGMINDVTALEGDPESLAVAAQSSAYVCLMHMQGQPQTMQDDPHYDDVIADITAYLRGRIEACRAAGIDQSRLLVDPGIGFGKTLAHNLTILRHLEAFEALGVPVLLGLSRKSFIEKLCPDTPASERLPGSLAGALWGAQRGVAVLRVHDVAATRQALTVWRSIQETLQ